MARRSPDTEPAAAQVCCISFAYERDGIPTVVAAGDVLAADDPGIVGREAFFAPVGTPTADRPKVTDFTGPGVQTHHHGIY